MSEAAAFKCGHPQTEENTKVCKRSGGKGTFTRCRECSNAGFKRIRTEKAAAGIKDIRRSVCKCGGNKDVRSEMCQQCRTDSFVTDGLKECTTCHTNKPVEEFGERLGGRRFRASCRECEAVKAKVFRASNPIQTEFNRRNWEKNNPEKQKVITVRRSAKQLVVEGDVEFAMSQALSIRNCEICGVSVEDAGCGSKHRLCIDHDHGTGRFRGILCGRCNMGIGCFSDDPEIMLRAVKYVQRTPDPLPN